ncbi:MCM DNA helicase complex subunit [Tyrophagus putrescentiae]|nr:MCM DNA helicase complex subunit [Tyrophagus putrescentiae]
MIAPPSADQDIDRQRQSQYLDFLDDESDEGIYAEAVKHMIKVGEQRLLVNINDVRRKMPTRVKALLNNSIEELVLFQNALKEFVASRDPAFANKYDEFLIGFEGSFGNKHATPRNLSSSLLGSIIAIEGIVTKCSLVRPKWSHSVHYCEVTKKKIERKFTDLTSLSAYPSSTVHPTKDEDGNLLETEFGLSALNDHQTLTIQEMPEKAPPGAAAPCKPGDRVLIVGPYRCLPNKQGYYTSGTFRTILLGTHINLLNKEVDAEIMPEDIKKCQRFSRQKDVFETLARSLAPSIYGYEIIKKALLCMLLGGMEKILPNGTRLRGDINILLIGDPSVSKSQLLRYVLHCAPRAVATTGRGSSGVGLTAAVTTDAETGDRRLEAGAMVLADRGVVCIDEFDKMSDIDRTAIHEVMEQGRVTITKAGIQAKLNARCSVLAAANPVYGRYDQYKTPMDNIGLQDSLLSRFDCIFIMLDKNDVDNDTEISDHVVRMHRYRSPGEADGEPLPIRTHADFLTTKDSSKLDGEETETPVYEKYDPLLHGKRKRNEKIVSMDFMKKYIHIAKAIKPQLTEQASEIIAQEYTKLRDFDLEQSDVARTQPVTARTLETLIRLSTAHARARLSTTIDDIDATAAVEMVQYSHFQKVLEKPRKRRTAATGDEGDDDDDEGGDEGAEGDGENMETDEAAAGPSTSTGRRGDAKRTRDVYEFDGDTEGPDGEPAPSTSAGTSLAAARPPQPPPRVLVDLSEDRLKAFKQFLFKIFRKEMLQSLMKTVVLEAVREEANTERVLNFTEDEVESALSKMQDNNQIFLSGDLIILV